MIRSLLVALILTALFVGDALAVGNRSRAVKRAFAKEHPCPTTEKSIPSCPGYVIDHKIPLCAGGPDAVSNMQWQTLAESYRKDASEREYCACVKKDGKANCYFAYGPRPPLVGILPADPNDVCLPHEQGKFC